jgi:hypothetical protein
MPKSFFRHLVTASARSLCNLSREESLLSQSRTQVQVKVRLQQYGRKKLSAIQWSGTAKLTAASRRRRNLRTAYETSLLHPKTLGTSTEVLRKPEPRQTEQGRLMGLIQQLPLQKPSTSTCTQREGSVKTAPERNISSLQVDSSTVGITSRPATHHLELS